MGLAAVTIWSDQLDTIYASEIAVDAELDTGTEGEAVSVRAIDKTSGVEVSGEGDASSIRAAAFVRMSQLTGYGLARGDLQGGTLTIDSKSWRIDGHTLRPNPDGELKGEICIFLMDGDA